MIDAGGDGDEIDKDSGSWKKIEFIECFYLWNLDESDNEEEKKSPKKRAGYEKDEDFDVSDAKNDDEFAPEQNR
jgi:hypothetical protein